MSSAKVIYKNKNFKYEYTSIFKYSAKNVSLGLSDIK